MNPPRLRNLFERKFPNDQLGNQRMIRELPNKTFVPNNGLTGR